ncbi:MAG: Rpn family recombination-promoting nuclease/putative transposase [Methylococcaceae bacterium]|nr:Rpn family recombination-promoting nuclease/putative transposase [Methylococcaceae bacterium]
MKTDTLFYRLFKQQPSLLFELTSLQVPHPEGYRFQSVEIKQTAFRIDGVFLPPAEETGSPLVFAEVQYRKDTKIYSRLFSEALLYLRQHEPPQDWRAVVIFPNESADPGVSVHHLEFFESGRLQRLYLENLPANERDSLGSDLLRLVMIGDEQAIACVERLKHRIRGQPAPMRREWMELLETILVYKWPRLTRDEVRQMLGDVLNVELKQTRFYQDVFAEGRQEGQQEGRQEGRQEGEQVLLLRQLKRRFGPLPEGVEQRLAQATTDQLERWAERVLEAPTLAAMFEE